MKLYYVYQHRRKDNGEVFYVGMAKKQLDRMWGHNTEYARAYAKRSRRDILWWEIVVATPYTVEIVFETNSYEEAQAAERKFITKYGRKSLKEGALVNWQGGGIKWEGIVRRDVKICQMDMNGKLIKIWNQPMDIEKETGFLRTNIVKCCRKKQKTAYGYTWKYSDNTAFNAIEVNTSRKKSNPNVREYKGVKIHQFTIDGKHVSSYPSQSAASRATNIDRASINHTALGNRTTAGGFLWTYGQELVLPMKRCIEKYTVDGKYVTRYKTLKEAADSVNSNRGTGIHLCLAGANKSGVAYGFRWKEREIPLHEYRQIK